MCTLGSDLGGKLKTEALINPEDRVMVNIKMKYFFILANYQLTLCLFILLLLFQKGVTWEIQWLSAMALLWLQNLTFHEKNCLMTSGIGKPQHLLHGILILIKTFHWHFLQSWNIYNSSSSYGFQSL